MNPLITTAANELDQMFRQPHSPEEVEWLLERLVKSFAPDANTISAVENNAQYWLKAGREESNRNKAVMYVEQAMNAYKNAFYALVRRAKGE